MPRCNMGYIQQIRVEREHPLFVAPELGGTLVEGKKRTVWRPRRHSRLFFLGCYYDGRATSYYWLEYYDEGCFVRRQKEKPLSQRTPCRIEIVPREEVPLELLMRLHGNREVIDSSYTTEFLGALGRAERDEKASGITGQRLSVEPVLRGRIVLVRGAERNKPWSAKWIPPDSSRLKVLRTGDEVLPSIFLYQPPAGSTVLLQLSSYPSNGDTMLGFTHESWTNQELRDIAESEGAWYVR